MNALQPLVVMVANQDVFTGFDILTLLSAKGPAGAHLDSDDDIMMGG